MALEKITTLVGVEKVLREKGFTANFRFTDGQLKNAGTEKTYAKNQITILSQFRFEGMTNPADMSIIFAIEAEDGTKGQLVSAYGIYADQNLFQFMDEVKIKNRTEIGQL